ncbi:hypothetical protein ACX0G9_21530 [Flavitalea flava]
MVDNVKLHDLLRKDLNLSEPKANEFLLVFNDAVKGLIMEQQVTFKSLWKEDFLSLSTKMTEDFHFLHKEILKQETKTEQIRSELTKAIFWSGLVQLIAILGSLIAMVNFLMKK